MKLLYIDDDQMMVRLVGAVLKSSQFSEVRTLSNPMQAESVFLEMKPDIVLVDYHMPEMNGDEVINKLKTLPSGDKVVFIFLSAIEDQQMLIDKCSPNGILKKPLNPQSLEKQIMKIYQGNENE